MTRLNGENFTYALNFGIQANGVVSGCSTPRYSEEADEGVGSGPGGPPHKTGGLAYFQAE
jgi:hypothetical protein